MVNETTKVGSAGVPATLLESLRWRCIGPYRGGRVVAVAGHPVEQMVFYFGACGGGVWKTTDGGTLWENVSDGYFNTSAVGAIAVAESDPNVVYAGTGESCIRGNVLHGDGVYKSTDGGKTWSHMGLEATRHISRIRVHPSDSNVVYVSALGRAFGPNEDRGVFRSTDGGKTWDKVLYKSEDAGAADLSLDPTNPRVIYAAIWQARRRPWEFVSGGENSGVYKSTDGGDTWAEITDNPGLPKGVKGRIGVSASAARAGRVWALVEAEERGLYRSDDGGASWERTNDEAKLMQRPWYYSHVFADPSDPETVYVLNTSAWRSTDAGSTFTEIKMPHGDHHDLWIDPHRPQRMIEGNDGGACVSFDAGGSWSSIYNQPTSQFYHVTTDNQTPYRVYGTQQDNTAISVPSRSHKVGILWSDCYTVGNSESGHIAVHPDNPNIVYSGAIGSSPGGGDSLLRYDREVEQVRIVSVWPEFYWGWGVKDHKYRFQWTYPIVFSPHDSGVLYVAANVVFRSNNEGSSWEVISPDLTRNDISKMEASGGPVTKDTTFVENYGTIFSFLESPHEPGVLWAGSDDGLVHLSRDGGKTWNNVTPKELPEWTLIGNFEASPDDSATVYLCGTRYKHDDVSPYLYKTDDYGETWTKITGGIPDGDFTRVIRADRHRKGLLYAGTETGVSVSFDDGGAWQSLRSNLPPVSVQDLSVRDNELVAASQGRSFWILDDLSLLRQLDDSVVDSATHVFQPAAAQRAAPAMDFGRPTEGKVYGQSVGAPAIYNYKVEPSGESTRTMLNAGTNPPQGVLVSYHLDRQPEEEVTLAFLDSSGTVIKQFSSQPQDKKCPEDWPDEPVVPKQAGMNRFLWNMRYPDATLVKDGYTPRSAAGPLAPVGRYQVRLTVADNSQTQPFELVKDPKVSATQQDLDEQFALLITIRDKVSYTHRGIARLRSVRRQADEWVARAASVGKEQMLLDRAEQLKGRLSEIEVELIDAKSTDYDRIGLPQRLNAKMAELTSVVSSADSAPTRQSYDVFEELSARIDVQLDKLQDVIDSDLAEFVNVVHELEVPAISPESSP